MTKKQFLDLLDNELECACSMKGCNHPYVIAEEQTLSFTVKLVAIRLIKKIPAREIQSLTSKYKLDQAKIDVDYAYEELDDLMEKGLES